MEYNIDFIKDEQGRIVEAIHEDIKIDIIWENDKATVEYCNLIIMEVCGNRRIEK